MKNRQSFTQFVRKATTLAAIAALMLCSPALSSNSFAAANTRTLHFTNFNKKVDITVEVHGKIDGYSISSIEKLVSEWLEVAHLAVVNADGVDVLELKITVSVDDDDDDNDGVLDSKDEDDDGDGDGKGWHVHSECEDWDEDNDADTIDAIDDLLHEMIEDFIEKYVK